MKQKLLILLAALLATVSAYAYDFEVDGIYYNKLSSTEVKVTSGGDYQGNIVIPSTVSYQGTTYSVTSIGEYAFQDCTSLTSVTISNSVTLIGRGAFSGCSNLASVTIGNSVTSIGDSAFVFCYSLTSVTIPNSVTSIGDGVFSNCHSLTSVTIPNSVTTVGGSAFYGCRNLASVTIGTSVTSIGRSAFHSCRNMISVAIPNSVTSIGDYAFSECSSLISVTIPNAVTSIGDGVFYSCSSLTSVTIPNSVTTVGLEAFSSCRSLTSVTIPNSVTLIGDHAFEYCSSLTSVTIPNSVISIRNSAFFCCSSLTSVIIPNSVDSIGDNAFSECWNLKSVTIPNSVTSIGNSAFYGCSSLASVNISSTDQLFNMAIGNGAWGDKNNIELYCNNQRVKEITVPGSVKALKPNIISPFSIEKIVLEDGVETIQKDAISDYGTRMLEIGKTVTRIEPLFNDVTLVKCHATTPPTINEGAFPGCSFNNDNPGVIVFDSADMEDTYLGAPVWKDLMTSNMENTVEVTVETPGDLAIEIILANSQPAKVVGLKVNGTLNDTDFEKMRVNMTALIDLDLTGLDFTSMPANCLNGKFQLESIKLPNGCTQIEEGALMGCSGLTSIAMPSKITTIGKNAFNGCSALPALTLPTSLNEICESAFEGCSALRSVKFNSRLTAIDTRAFANTGLHDIVLNDNLETIGNEAFHNSSLQNVTFGYGLTAIGDDAFAGCALNQELELPETLEAIGSGAFQGQSITGHLSLPEAVATVGARAFAGTEISTLFLNSSLTELSEGVFADCQNLNTIYVPDNITAINSHAFEGCSSLTNLRFSPTLTAIGSGAFKSSALRTAILPKGITAIESETFEECKNLRTASIPAGVTSLGDGAFRGCSTLRNLTVKMVEPPTINSSVFLGVNTNLCLLAIPTVSFKDYALANYWGRFVTMRNSIAVETVGNGSISFSSTDSQQANAPARAPQLAASANDDESAEAENGSTVYIPKGGMINFYITPAKGEEIVSATLDGVDITDQIVNGVFTTTADKSNAKLLVNFSGESVMKGDVNGDGKFSPLDVSMVVAYALGGEPTGAIFEAADVNNDKSITPVDVSLVVSYVLNGTAANAPRRGADIENSSATFAERSDISVNGDGDLELSISGIADYTAAMFDMELPEGATVSNVSLRDADGTGHAVAYSINADGKLRVLAYSALNHNFSSTSSFVIALDGQTAGNAGITVDGIRLVEADGNDLVEVSAEGCAASDPAGLASGIIRGTDIKVTADGVAITTDKECDITITDTMGRVFVHHLTPGANHISLPKGVYLIDNNKILIK